MKNLIKILFLLFIVAACDNSNETGTTRLKVLLTDAPAEYEEVLVDIREIHINYSGDKENNWEVFPIVHPGIYNLLELTNGIDTLLLDQEIPAGKIAQIRLLLGENNKIKSEGNYYDLKTPSAQSSGLKLKVNETLMEGITYNFWLDFDAGRSVVKRGNGDYLLKPVIRTFTEATGGAIQGTVSPIESEPYIMAISESNDTIGTYSNKESGYFLIKGLAPGDYSIKFSPVTGFSSKELINVSVLAGVVNELDTVHIDNNY